MFITVTGGSGSGKSAFAEESRKRVARHRQMRKDKQFETLECYTDLEHAAIPYGSTVLLECMSNLTANEIFSPDGAKDQAYEAVCRGLLHLKEQAGHVCVVTNEIFSDGISYDMETQNYQRVLGKLNAFLAEISDACYEVVYGIPLKFR